MKKSDQDSIFVRADYRLNRVRYSDIYYIEALKDYVVINTEDNIYTTTHYERNAKNTTS